MHPVLNRNLYLVKEKVGMFKAANNYDIFDPETGEEIIHCREENIGMLTKILAAKRAASSGASTVIAWGREPDVLLRLAAGESIGTALLAGTPKLAARKQWMADHLQLRGGVTIDDGAVTKLRTEGKSLLPIGMTEVQGEFARGDVIAVFSQRGVPIARGLANYSASEARLIARRPSTQIAALLGCTNEPEMIHRDNLVLV